MPNNRNVPPIEAQPANPVLDAANKVDTAVSAYRRLQNVIDRNIGFPECVEASNAFIMAAFEAMPAMMQRMGYPK